LVSWDDAVAYCTWVGAQLPTEAQWEYAVRGEDGRNYPWGNEFDCHLANADDETIIDNFVVSGGAGCDGYNRTSPTGNFSPFGDSWVNASDTAGNVWEWVADWYSSDYYEISPEKNPNGPQTGNLKVMRGGSWNVYERDLRATYRDYYPQDNNHYNVGFRCVVTIGS
jgi:sulfatase modifying factor 1